MVLLKSLIISISLMLLSSCISHNNIKYLVKQNYINDFNNSCIVKDKSNNTTLKLDKYSKILKDKDLKNINILTSGKYKGIGILIAKDENGIYIFETIKNSKAEKKGILKFDRLIKINDKLISNMNIKDVSKYMKSRVSSFTLTLKRNSINYKVELENSEITIPIVQIKKFKNTLYVKIVSFKDGLSTELTKIIKKEKNLKKLVIDLRDNRGGLFSEALKLSNIFLNSGVIVTEKYKDKTNIYKAFSDSFKVNIKIIIIVNENTASASEIFTGALRDNNRATIYGVKTFGKASIQRLIPLSDNKLLKITVATYILPSGKNIEGIGIKPDYILSRKQMQLLGSNILEVIK